MNGQVILSRRCYLRPHSIGTLQCIEGIGVREGKLVPAALPPPVIRRMWIEGVSSYVSIESIEGNAAYAYTWGVGAVLVRMLAKHETLL
jgi:hypothetical protein